jgi:TetR/AcrR family transcriptional regulator, cholesterol catabolism regulator
MITVMPTKGKLNAVSSDVRTTILNVSAETLAASGLADLQLREVARRAQVSLTTCYKHFPSREELVVAAVEYWMAEHVYRPVPQHGPDQPLAEALVSFLRWFFDPWKQNPTMLNVFLQAALLPGGERLGRQGSEAFGPGSTGLFDGYDSDFAEDIQLVLGLLTEGLLARFAAGQIDMDGILDVYERAVLRLTEAR